MMKRRCGGKPRLLTGMAFLCSAPGPVVSAAQEPLWGGRLISKVDSLAEATLSEGLVSGLSVGVKRGDELLLAHGYGFADLENMVRSDAETIYGIGSVTKQFTCLMEAA